MGRLRPDPAGAPRRGAAWQRGRLDAADEGHCRVPRQVFV